MVCKLPVSVEQACDQFVFQCPRYAVFAWQTEVVFSWGSDSHKVKEHVDMRKIFRNCRIFTVKSTRKCSVISLLSHLFWSGSLACYFGEKLHTFITMHATYLGQTWQKVNWTFQYFLNSHRSAKFTACLTCHLDWRLSREL